MNFIFLIFIFRKYLQISKILLFARTLFYDKNFEHNFSKFGGSGGPNGLAHCPLYNTCMIITD